MSDPRQDPSDVRILHGQHVPHCVARVDKHFLGYCSLQYLSAGAVELSYGRARRILEPGWLWPCMPGPQIRFHAAPGHRQWNHRYIAVAGPGVERWRASGLWPSQPQVTPSDYPCSETFDRMLALATTQDPWSQRRAVHLLEDILLALAAQRPESVIEDWVASARERLSEADGPGCDIATIARDSGLSPATFRRRFRAATGMSPREFTMQARLERARRLLLETDTPITAIAEALDYRDAFLFSRQFKARFGLSPKHYRTTRLA